MNNSIRNSVISLLPELPRGARILEIGARNVNGSVRDLFDGISIDKISVTFNTTGIVILAMYFAMAQERGLNLRDLWGTALNNPLASYVSCNSGVLPAPKDALRELTDIVEFTTQIMPRWNPLNIGSYEYRENGANAVQELAFMFGNAIAYTDSFLILEEHSFKTRAKALVDLLTG